MNKIFIAVLAVVLFASTSYAEPPEWLYKAIKVDNPNQLTYYVGVAKSCPVSKEEVTKIAEGVLVRSRIKPIKEDFKVQGRVYLNLILDCVRLKNQNPVFSFNVNFARYAPLPAVVFDYSFAFNGIGPKDYIEQNVKGQIERSVEAFLKSNFDL